MSIAYNKIHRYFFQPAADFVTGWDVVKKINFLNKSQWWSKEQIYDYQCNKLRKIIMHAYYNTRFYKRKFDEYGINPESIRYLDDLKKLPIISKTEYRKNNSDILAFNAKNNSYIKTSTSGSTGQQLQYSVSKNAYGFINAAALRGWGWAGYSLGDPYIKITQNKRKTFTKKIQDFVNKGYLFTDAYNEQGFEILLNLLKKVKPFILRSYPDPLIFLSYYIKRQKIELPSLHAIATTGNTLFNEDRELIENSFGARIFDSYSCEGSTHADECETHDCYHLTDEYAITEIIDNDGNEVGAGKSGKLITTDLHNYAMPFIRYDTRDLVIKGAKNCSCGRELNSITKILGRANDILITPQRQFLIGQTFTTFFKHYKNIKQFQVNQDKSNHIRFDLVIEDKISEETIDEISKYWRDYTNNSMDFDVKILDEIPLRYSGKRQFLVRDKNIELLF